MTGNHNVMCVEVIVSCPIRRQYAIRCSTIVVAHIIYIDSDEPLKGFSSNLIEHILKEGVPPKSRGLDSVRWDPPLPGTKILPTTFTHRVTFYRQQT